MKKLAINTTLKKIVFALPWGWRFFKLWRFSRKYTKEPDRFPIAQRWNTLTKWCEKILKLYNVDLEVKGYENVERNNGFIMPNHKSNIDVIALIAALKNPSYEQGTVDAYASFISKDNQKKYVMWALALTDSFVVKRNDIRQSLEALNAFGDYVKEERINGVIFPEATRVKEEALGEFKAGPFKIAKKKYVPIVPCAISNTLNFFKRKRKGRTKITVSFLTPLKPQVFLTQDSDAIGKRVKKLIESELENINNENNIK